MAWCVPGCVDGDDARRDFITGPDAGRASFNGLEDAPCTSRDPLHRSLELCRLTQGPEIELPWRNDILSAWESQAVVQFVDQSSDVIGMRVGQHHLANLLGLDAGCLQAVGELARGRFPGAT